MTKIKTLDGIRQAKQEYSNLYNNKIAEIGVFFAFDEKQFNENKTPKNAKDNEFISLGAGGYIWKGNLQKLQEYNAHGHQKEKQDFLKRINKKAFILYELLNHEAFYTYELDDTLDTLKDYYTDITEDEISKVFRKHARKYADF